MKRLLVVFAFTLAACSSRQPPPPPAVERVDSVQLLARAFDANHGKPRFVTILSPT